MRAVKILNSWVDLDAVQVIGPLGNPYDDQWIGFPVVLQFQNNPVWLGDNIFVIGKEHPDYLHGAGIERLKICARNQIEHLREEFLKQWMEGRS